MNSRRLVSVVVPVYNEEAMINEVFERVKKVFDSLASYDFELVFFDDGSVDGTREKIKKLASENKEVKGVFYTKNFGYLKNTFYCVQQAKGDCAFLLHADLQNPPELIPEFLKKWENGADVVLGVKKKSRENGFMFFLRSVFYFLMIHIFAVKLTPHATEFELFDRSFIDILGKIKTETPFLRGIISEYAARPDFVYYTQDARKKGKSKFNLSKYYDFAMCGITQYSHVLPRRLIFLSIIAMTVLFAEFLFFLLPRVFSAGYSGIADSIILRCILFAMCFIVILISIVLEFIINAKKNSAEKPMITEEERINY